MFAARALVLALLALPAAAACGDRRVHRALEVDLGGVSKLAETVTLVAYPKSAQRDCASVSSATVRLGEAPFLTRWVRSSGAERRLSLPAIDEDQLTLVAYTEDAAGVVLQFACTVVTFAQIEEGFVSLRLPPVTAGIIGR